MLNEKINKINSKLTVEKTFDYNKIKSLAENVGSAKRPRYEAKKLTPEQVKLAKQVKAVENVTDLVKLVNENEVLDDNYNYFFVVKHLKMATRAQTPDKVQKNIGIVNRWVEKL